MSDAATASLAPLRRDLRLSPGPPAADGAPTFVLHDPAAHAFYALGCREIEALRRWHLGRADKIAAMVASETTFRPAVAEIDALHRMMAAAGLLRIDGRTARERAARDRGGSARIAAILQAALFRRVPLASPQRFLDQTLAFGALLFRPTTWITLLVLLVLALGLLQHQWAEFAASVTRPPGQGGLLATLVLLVLAKAAHEFSHAYAMRRAGADVPAMGIALIGVFPVLYTETSSAWTIPDRRQRMLVAAAGLMAETAIAILALAMWPLMEPGPWRDAAGFAATALVLISLLVNANPLMRLDGYYVLAELTKLDNLRPRAIAAARAALGRLVTGIKALPPERTLSRPARTFIVAFGLATLAWQIVIVAVLVHLIYALLFPALAVPLIVLLIAAMAIIPAMREVGRWLGEAAKSGGVRRVGRVLAILTLAALPFILPWQTTVSAPAVIETGEAHDIYAPEPARVVAVGVRPGEVVGAGTLIISLESPEISHRLTVLQQKASLLDRLLDRRLTGQSFHERQEVQERELGQIRADIAGLMARRTLLSLLATREGRVMHIEAGLTPGVWVRPDQRLAQVVGAGTPRAISYVGERDIGLVKAGAVATVWLEGLPRGGLRAVVVAVHVEGVETLDEPALAATAGGPIAARAGPRGTLVPEAAIYKVRLALDDPELAGILHSRMRLRALARIETPPRSLISRLAGRLVGIWRREIG